MEIGNQGETSIRLATLPTQQARKKGWRLLPERKNA